VGDEHDLLVAYRDRTVRYLNYAGSAVIVEDAMTSALAESLSAWFAVADALAAHVGVWDRAELPPLPSGYTRALMLTPGGKRFGQGPDELIRNDPSAAAYLNAATSVLTEVTSLGRQSSEQDATANPPHDLPAADAGRPSVHAHRQRAVLVRHESVDRDRRIRIHEWRVRPESHRRAGPVTQPLGDPVLVSWDSFERVTELRIAVDELPKYCLVCLLQQRTVAPPTRRSLGRHRPAESGPIPGGFHKPPCGRPLMTSTSPNSDGGLCRNGTREPVDPR
jgi:hypothetical protein